MSLIPFFLSTASTKPHLHHATYPNVLKTYRSLLCFTILLTFHQYYLALHIWYWRVHRSGAPRTRQPSLLLHLISQQHTFTFTNHLNQSLVASASFSTSIEFLANPLDAHPSGCSSKEPYLLPLSKTPPQPSSTKCVVARQQLTVLPPVSS